MFLQVKEKMYLQAVTSDNHASQEFEVHGYTDDHQIIAEHIIKVSNLASETM